LASLINGLDPTAAMTVPASIPLLGGGPPPAPRDLNYVQGGPRANHMAEADATMDLSPEEKFLYNTHLQNLNGTGKIVHPDGSISSLLQMSFEQDGKFYNIPTVWGGKQLDPVDAIKAARAVGLDRFPSYKSEDEAEARYEALHHFLERDTSEFMAGAKPAGQP
jgi:hypothetical protein